MVTLAAAVLVLLGGMGIYAVALARRRLLVSTPEEEATMRQLKGLLYADQSLKDELISIGPFAPELQQVLVALDGGRFEDALRRANEMVATSPTRVGVTLMLAHARAACGDREGAAKALKGFLATVRGSSHATLQTWHRLRALGVEPPPEEARKVLGVIVEIALPEGPDTVAAYADGSSRFFSRMGGAIIGEDRRPGVEEAARRVVAEAESLVRVAEKEPSPRLPPRPDTVQFTFLTPSGPLVRSSSKAALRTGLGELAPLFEPAAELIALKVQGR